MYAKLFLTLVVGSVVSSCLDLRILYNPCKPDESIKSLPGKNPSLFWRCHGWAKVLPSSKMPCQKFVSINMLIFLLWIPAILFAILWDVINQIPAEIQNFYDRQQFCGKRFFSNLIWQNTGSQFYELNNISCSSCHLQFNAAFKFLSNIRFKKYHPSFYCLCTCQLRRVRLVFLNRATLFLLSSVSVELTGTERKKNILRRLLS